MKRHFRITFNAPVTLIFIFLCFIATVFGVITNGVITKSFFMTFNDSLLNPMTYLRLFTHVLGHEGWEHFFGNASIILLLGPLLEEKYKSNTIIEVILITALVTGLANSILFPNVALCGASGVVFSFIVLASFTSFKQGEIPLTFILVIVVYLGQQVLQGLFISDNISNMTHIIGGFVGAVIGYNLNVKNSYY